MIEYDIAYRIISSNHRDFKRDDYFFIDEDDEALIGVIDYLDRNDWEPILASDDVEFTRCHDAVVLKFGREKIVAPISYLEERIKRQKPT